MSEGLVAPEDDAKLQQCVSEEGIDPNMPGLFVWWRKGRIPRRASIWIVWELYHILGVRYRLKRVDNLVVLIVTPMDIILSGKNWVHIERMTKRFDNLCTKYMLS